MNEFMVLVERAVRPVQVGPKRKLRMREELLAHLTGIYEEELTRTGDAAAARAEAARRFGDPAALTVDLVATVTRRDRIDARLSRAFGWRPGESAARHSARLAGIIALVLVGVMLLTVGTDRLANSAREQPTGSGGLFVRFWALVVVLGSATVFLMSLFGARIRNSLHGAFGSPRSWQRVLGYATVMYLALLAAGLVLRALIVPEMGAMAQHMTETRAAALTAAGYLFIPLFVVTHARRAGRNEIRHVEWASLDIGQ